MTVTVRAKRESLGWLQKELAKKANVSESTVWRAENGKAIRRLYATRIAIALEESLDNLEIPIIDKPES